MFRDRPMGFWPRGVALAAGVALALALWPALGRAQAGADLVVNLRDAAHAPLPAIGIVVAGEDGARLAEQATDAGGQATFRGLPPVVRVRVEGQPRRGPALFQTGADAAGVRMVLDAGASHTLDLRAEPDGMVLPDPATMIDRADGPIAPPPLELSPIPQASPQAAIGGAAPEPPLLVTVPAPAVEHDPAGWTTFLAFAAALAALAGVALLRLWRHRP